MPGSEYEGAAYSKTLKASEVDTVKFGYRVGVVRIVNKAQTVSDANAIYVTLNGSAPTVKGVSTLEVPANTVLEEVTPRGENTVVKLIAEGTPEYSVGPGTELEVD